MSGCYVSALGLNGLSYLRESATTTPGHEQRVELLSQTILPDACIVHTASFRPCPALPLSSELAFNEPKSPYQQRLDLFSAPLETCRAIPHVCLLQTAPTFDAALIRSPSERPFALSFLPDCHHSFRPSIDIAPITFERTMASAAGDPLPPSRRHDLMNDPTFMPEGKPDEVCRICRGEGSHDEPLFYPCKCSGSIKFVHQECLMEWLSHSQKKYCELCKTPFRFTKLYHPQMPRRLPAAVFCHRAIVHVFSYLLTWCRGFLVGFVWLICLPLAMRMVWRWLFWVGDAGWARDATIRDFRISQLGNNTASSDLSSVVSSISSAFEANSTEAAQALPSILSSFSRSSNRTLGEIAAFGLLRTVFFRFNIAPYSGVSLTELQAGNSSNATNLSHLQHSSMLSDVAFFSSFSSSPLVNRIILDIFEGQVITVVVVIAFILIFLIREWVVQQQPIIALGRPEQDVAERADIDGEPNNAAAGEEEEDDEEGEVEEGDAAIETDFEPRGAPTADSLEHTDVHRQADHNIRMVEPQERSDRHERTYGPGDSMPAGLRQRLETEFAASRGTSEENYTMDTAPHDNNFSHNQPRHEHHERLRVALEEMGENLPNEMRETYMQAHRVDQVLQNMEGATVDEIDTLLDKITALSRDLQTQMEEYRQGHSDGSNNREASVTRGEEVDNKESTNENNTAGPSRLTESEVIREAWSDNVLLQGRPNMPSRDRSFIATKIQRDIEEIRQRGEDPVADRRDDDQMEDGPNSEDSSEGWQNVSDLDEEAVTRAGSELQAGGQSSNSGRLHMSDRGGAWTSDESDADDRSTTSDLPPSTVDLNELSGSRSPSPAPVEVERTGTAPPEENPPVQIPAVVDANDRAAAPPPRRLAAPPEGVIPHIIDWLWGDVAPVEVDMTLDGGLDENAVRDVADEDPFQPFEIDEAPNDVDEFPNDAVQDPEVAAAAAEAGIEFDDPDAVEDAEDLEGILELIGMQGPITGLFQNAIFSAVLIAATLIGGIGIPYIFGKLVLFVIGNPLSTLIKMPLQLVSSFADFIVDLAAGLITTFAWATIFLFNYIVKTFTFTFLEDTWYTAPMTDACDKLLTPMINSWERICDNLSRLETAGDFLWFSTSSHAALRMLQDRTSNGVAMLSQSLGSAIDYLGEEASLWSAPHYIYMAITEMHRFEMRLWHRANDVAVALWGAKSLKISLDFAHVTYSDDIALQYWDAKDRIVATLAGYALFAAAGIVYQKRLLPITSSEHGRKVEGIISEILQQTGGVFKVILIISIEMIAFPLYCGILLDVAMLPLCVGATMRSRFNFAMSSPWTAGFVHWFIGTCYMFHFALFVSMCRKIMRRGVLYFIRDPDDPTFHPVRDVLERNVTTQLRKITFSAMVYGALIIICLGGVVWTLDLGFQTILPIHWNTNQPALEFPLDLLIYSFLTPLVARALKPNDTLQTIYTWWFQTCAHFLRLSDFLFGSRPRDEEGHHVRRTWRAWFRRQKGDVTHPSNGKDRKQAAEDLDSDVYFKFDGRFVRAPATDQVRIPKGQRVFVDVDENDNRLDDVSEEDSGVHAKTSKSTKMVYIPPHFRLRIAAFIFLLWFFAAATGVGVTVLPLVMGRYALSFLTPPDWKPNDIYAFSIGAYALGGLKYLIMDLRASNKPTTPAQSPSEVRLPSLAAALVSIRTYALQTLSFLYVYSFFTFIIPLLFTVCLELYILLPLHTYVGADEPHVVHLVQDWTLGFLYARICYRTFFSDRNSRPARALQAVVRDGYLKPNARLATRCFILPLTVLTSLAIVVPMVPYLTIKRHILPRLLSPEQATDPELHKLLARYAYPVVLASFLIVYGTQETGNAVAKWRRIIKDEVYLIGERLHNFNEARPGPMTSALGKVVRDAEAEAAAQAAVELEEAQRANEQRAEVFEGLTTSNPIRNEADGPLAGA